jgi:hypothetical protein
MNEADVLTGKSTSEIAQLLTDKNVYLAAGNAQRLLLIFALAAVLLGIFGAVYEISKERAIYRRERTAGINILSYLFSKIGVLLGFGLAQILSLLFLVTLKVRLPADAIMLGMGAELYVTLLLALLAGVCFGLFISALANQLAATYIVLVVIFIQILFSGALFDLDGPAGLASQLTLTHWTLDALGSSVNLARLKSTEQIAKEFEFEVVAPTGQKETRKERRQFPAETKLAIDYQHTRDHLTADWRALLFWAAVYTGGAYAVLKKQDVV